MARRATHRQTVRRVDVQPLETNEVMAPANEYSNSDEESDSSGVVDEVGCSLACLLVGHVMARRDSKRHGSTKRKFF